jgi:hypothetical protein
MEGRWSSPNIICGKIKAEISRGEKKCGLKYEFLPSQYSAPKWNQPDPHIAGSG